MKSVKITSTLLHGNYEVHSLQWLLQGKQEKKEEPALVQICLAGLWCWLLSFLHKWGVFSPKILTHPVMRSRTSSPRVKELEAQSSPSWRAELQGQARFFPWSGKRPSTPKRLSWGYLSRGQIHNCFGHLGSASSQVAPWSVRCLWHSGFDIHLWVKLKSGNTANVLIISMFFPSQQLRH